MAEKKKGVLRSFSGTYWLVVFFEFMERGSYYGMMSVLSIYLTEQLGFAKTSVGLIKGTIQPILYFLPIISGALADRFGYRRTLMVAFAFLGGGYFLTAQMTSYTAIFLALCVMALGAGTFKPIITGSIARTTDKSNSTLGFGIYYWSINLGAFLFPLILVPFLKNSPMFGWKWVILASALGTGAMLIPTIFFMKEPPKEKDESKGKELNIIKTVANAFEIIYSPFVLIYHYLRSSKNRAVSVYLIVALILVLSLWQYSKLNPVVEKLNKATHIENGTALTFVIERNVMKQSQFSIKKLYFESVDGYNLNFELKPDPEATESTKRIQQDGKDLSVTILKPAAESLHSDMQSQFEGMLDFPKALLDSTIKNFTKNDVNRITVTISNPDKFSEYETDLLNQLQMNQSLESITSGTVQELFVKIQEKSELTVKIEKPGDNSEPYSIEEIASNNLVVSIYQTENVESYKFDLLKNIRNYSNYLTLTQTELDELVNSSQQRSFFPFFLVLIFISSLVILAIQKIYVEADKATKAIINLIVSAFIVAVIWLAPGLDIFSRIISTVIYFTVLSLFTIETDDNAKFKDNFRFLLMIFIYSGFWILYFQMFDSVLWYVKAYVDATSLNNFVNVFLGKLGLNINWFFDVEHVTVINAGTIIILQLVISNIVKNTKALPTMIVGIAMGTVGMAILAISTSIWVFMAGIFIFSIGEMTAHPKFYSYVGLIAPKDRVATYMGYIFLYGVIGSSIGAILGANMYVHFVDKLNQPRTLWLVFSGIGIATIVGLLLYNKFTPKLEESTSDG
jgi:dipeptide/tripeptide permease